MFYGSVIIDLREICRNIGNSTVTDLRMMNETGIKEGESQIYNMHGL
jgi:hypothetical protein